MSGLLCTPLRLLLGRSLKHSVVVVVVVCRWPGLVRRCCVARLMLMLYYNPEQSIVEQVLRGPTSTVTTPQPTAAEASALPTAAVAPKQEPVAATVVPVTNVVSAATSTAANDLSGATASAVPLAATPAPVVFKQIQRPRTHNGSTRWKVYKAHFERICKVNNWNTAQDRDKNLTLALEGPAADVLKILISQHRMQMTRSGNR